MIVSASLISSANLSSERMSFCSSFLAGRSTSQSPAETWGNARFVANLLERIYIQHATRCVRHYPKDKHDLLMLTPDDIVSIETARQRPKIGF